MKEKLIVMLVELLMKLDRKPLNGYGETLIKWHNHKIIYINTTDEMKV